VLAHESFDIWSLGVLLYQMCNRDVKPLFDGGVLCASLLKFLSQKLEEARRNWIKMSIDSFVNVNTISNI
jgi:hypothetical protein